MCVQERKDLTELQTDYKIKYMYFIIGIVSYRIAMRNIIFRRIDSIFFSCQSSKLFKLLLPRLYHNILFLFPSMLSYEYSKQSKQNQWCSFDN